MQQQELTPKAQQGLDWLKSHSGVYGLGLINPKGTIPQLIINAAPFDALIHEFNMNSIFEQLADFAMHQLHQKFILMFTDDNAQITGTPADCARFYCLHENVKLYIMPEQDSNNEEFYFLRALFNPDNSNVLTDIAVFEESDVDIETAYALFFTEHLQPVCANTQETHNFRILSA